MIPEKRAPVPMAPAGAEPAADTAVMPSIAPEGAGERLTEVLGRFGAEWVPFDTTTLFASPPTSDDERDAWVKKPRMPLRTQALTAEPIVRYLGRDDDTRTVEGWRRWIPVVAGWLREGRSPTLVSFGDFRVRG